MKKQIRHFHKNNKGSTMVEVLVGFSLLVILMAGVSRVIDVSVNMFMYSKTIQNEQLAFQEKYFKTVPEGLVLEKIVSAGNVYLVETDMDGEIKSGGSTVFMPEMELWMVSDEESGIRMYRFNHKD